MMGTRPMAQIGLLLGVQGRTPSEGGPTGGWRVKSSVCGLRGGQTPSWGNFSSATASCFGEDLFTGGSVEPWQKKVQKIVIKLPDELDMRLSAHDDKDKEQKEDQLKAMSIKQHKEEHGEDPTNFSDGNKKKRLILKSLAQQFHQAGERCTETAFATDPVLIWTEEVINVPCPELAEYECAADRDFERFAKHVYAVAPEMHIIRLVVPMFAMSELGKYGILDPWDLIKGTHEEAEGGTGTQFPRLSQLRVDEIEDKGINKHGRLFATYEQFGKDLTSIEKKPLKLLQQWVQSRRKTGFCARDNAPSRSINGCCAPAKAK